MGPAERRARLAPVLLAASAIVVTASYFAEYARLPFLRAPILDSMVYLRQASAISAGNFGDPTLLAYSPLYGYFLVAAGATMSTLVPVLVQLGLGLVNLYLIVRLVDRRSGGAAAILAGALYLGYGLFLFYETKIQSETLGLTLILLAYSLYASPRFARGQARRAIGCGVLVGLSVLARASLLFSAPLFAAGALLPWSLGEAWRPRWRRAAGVALGIALPLLANGAWNWSHTGFFVPVTFVSGALTRTTARAEFSGDFRDYAGAGKRSANSWDVVQQADDRLHHRSGPDGAPGASFDLVGYLEQAPAKALQTFSDLEMTRFEYLYYGERDELQALGMLPVSFGALLVLAFVGAIAVGREDGFRALIAHLPLVVGILATTTLFYPSSRYRIPMVLPFIIVGSAGAVQLARAARRPGAWALRGLAAAVAVACVAFAVRTMTYRRQDPVIWEVRVAQSAALLHDEEELLYRQRLACAEDRVGADENFHKLLGRPTCDEIGP